MKELSQGRISNGLKARFLATLGIRICYPCHNKRNGSIVNFFAKKKRRSLIAWKKGRNGL